jgi:tagatose-1,6-bisphosphate aldolase
MEAVGQAETVEDMVQLPYIALSAAVVVVARVQTEMQTAMDQITTIVIIL